MMNAAAGIFLAARRKPKLPYDAEVEYLENISGRYNTTGGGYISSVGSYINTGINPSGTGIVKIGLQVTETVSDPFQAWFGGYDSNTRNFGVVARKNWVYFLCGNQSSKSFSYSLGSRLDVEYDCFGKSLTVNGNTETFSGSGFNGASGLEIYLFTDNAVGSFATYNTSYTMKGMIYYFQYIENGEIKADLIPVRFTNELGVPEGAMYDRSGTGGMNPDGSPRPDGLYRNRGTGAFVIGPDKAA